MHYDFYIRNDKLMCSKLFSPYTGNVNTYVCTFNINTRFKGLQWFCVFKQDNTAIAQPILNNSCKIPAEVLTNSGTIEVGCYATNGDVNGLKRLSTNWLNFTTLTGAYVEAEAPEVPTPDVWETLVLKSIPYVGANGNWYVYSLDADDYEDTGIKAQGDTPKKGIDYWTYEDKVEVKGYIDEQTSALRSDVEGIQEQINTEAHFKGYLTTNAKIQALEATPNDFAYSAESGTKWVYDAVDGWQDTGSPVPDQLTPASDTTPLINGIASVGTEEAYARGDHRHPTDTTRASQSEVDELKYTVDGHDSMFDAVYMELSAVWAETEQKTYIDNYYDKLESTAVTYNFRSDYNCEKRYLFEPLSGISFMFGDGEYADDYTSGLSFDSGETPTAIDYADSGILNWVGTDCTNVDGLSIFQPSANTHYDIVFYFNGSQFIGLVNGFVPATGNVVSE